MSDSTQNTSLTNDDGAVEEVPAVAWNEQTFSLAEFPEKLAIVKLGPGAEVPRWAESSSFFSVTATATGTSLICAGRSVPSKTPSIQPLKAFRIIGEIDPNAIGVAAALLVPLAEAGLQAYTFSTFETDWILVRVVDADKVAEEWRRRGHSVAAAIPATSPRTKAEPRKEPRKGDSRKAESRKKGSSR